MIALKVKAMQSVGLKGVGFFLVMDAYYVVHTTKMRFMIIYRVCIRRILLKVSWLLLSGGLIRGRRFCHQQGYPV